MYDHNLPYGFPEWLRKDIVATLHEVPAARGRTQTAYENFYTLRVFRWALNQWLSCLPEDPDGRALRRALPIVLGDSQSFVAYMTVPDAFEELYRQELEKLNEERGELDRVKQVLRRRPRITWSLRDATTGLLLAYALVATALLR
jgi:hypothetical protein